MTARHFSARRLAAMLDALRSGLTETTVADWLAVGGVPAVALGACVRAGAPVLPDRLASMLSLPNALNVLEVRFMAGQLAVSFERADEGMARDRLAVAYEDLLAAPRDLPCGELVASYLGDLLAPIEVLRHPQLRRRWAPAAPPAGLLPDALTGEITAGDGQLLCAVVLADRNMQRASRHEAVAE